MNNVDNAGRCTRCGAVSKSSAGFCEWCDGGRVINDNGQCSCCGAQSRSTGAGACYTCGAGQVKTIIVGRLTVSEAVSVGIVTVTDPFITSSLVTSA